MRKGIGDEMPFLRGKIGAKIGQRKAVSAFTLQQRGRPVVPRPHLAETDMIEKEKRRNNADDGMKRAGDEAHVFVPEIIDANARKRQQEHAAHQREAGDQIFADAPAVADVNRPGGTEQHQKPESHQRMARHNEQPHGKIKPPRHVPFKA